ncbi:MAG: YpdA family putative bacillithiol disulfide reductase [Bacteroidota bacterium]
MTAYDLIIIGGGPSGLNVGLAAEKAGLNFLILEKGVLVNSIYHFPTNMTFFSTSKNLEIGDTPFISHTDKPTRKEALEYYRRLQQAYNLKVKMYEPVQRMEAVVGADVYEIQTAKDTYRARSVVVATGFYDTPRMLGVPGEDLSKVKHYYDDAHPYVGQKVLVIGAANSACDVALETYQKGAEVTMAVREHELYPKVKYWIKPNIENRIKEGSIEAHFNTVVKAIYPDRVDLEGPGGAFTIENDFVLAMTGYEPNYELLRALNLPISDDELALPIHDLETLVTPLPNVYLAGVVCAGRQTSKLFIENTRDHGEIIVQQIQAQQGIQV